MDTTEDQLNVLFPLHSSTLRTSRASTPFPRPTLQAGWTHDSSQTVVKLLKDNHQRYHIWYDDRGFHNHASHHLLAIYALGANSELLEAAYNTHTKFLTPAYSSPENGEPGAVINESNWKEYIGDQQYYQAYLTFFSHLVTETPGGIKATLEKYVFSRDANLVPNSKGEVPAMLCRFLGGLLHPLIHAGYGVEFSLPGLVAEGLAQTPFHWTDEIKAFPELLFDHISSAQSEVGKPDQNTHALAILERISKDPSFAPKPLGLPPPTPAYTLWVDQIVAAGEGALLKYVEEWASGLTPQSTPENIRAKYAEIVWLNTVIYGVCGWVGRKQDGDEARQFNADFFTMHLVTSSLLIPSLLDLLSPPSAYALLRSYFTISLIVYISRGRPPVPMSDFYAATTRLPGGPCRAPEFATGTLPPQNNPNPWNSILQTTLVHPDDHLCKLQRALSHCAQLYGGTPRGTFSKEGFEDLDGTVFLRVAGLTADRLRWMREGQQQGEWDRLGFFNEELF